MVPVLYSIDPADEPEEVRGLIGTNAGHKPYEALKVDKCIRKSVDEDYLLYIRSRANYCRWVAGDHGSLLKNSGKI